MKSLKLLILAMLAIALGVATQAAAQCIPKVSIGPVAYFVSDDTQAITAHVGDLVYYKVTAELASGDCDIINGEPHLVLPNGTTDIDLDNNVSMTAPSTKMYNLVGQVANYYTVDLGDAVGGYVTAFAEINADSIYDPGPPPLTTPSSGTGTYPIQVINPDTSVTIEADETTVISGDPVVLTVKEKNDGDDPLDSPYVELLANGSPLSASPLNRSSTEYIGGDNNPDNGDLDPGEEWEWQVTVNPTVDTTYTAIGHGTDSLGYDVTWCETPGDPPANTICDQDEKAEVPVDVIDPDTSVTIEADETTVISGDPVVLTVKEKNDGDDPLDSPYVELLANGSPLSASPLNRSSTEYIGGDNNPDNGDLDPGEEWEWQVTVNPTVDTTYAAIGHGTDSLGNDVTWCETPGDPPANTVCDQDEKAEVPVDVIDPDTSVTIEADETTVISGDPVVLTVKEKNDGDDPLDSPYVELLANGSPLSASPLNRSSTEYVGGDNNPDNGDLDPGEEWEWQVTVNPTVDTTYTAIGHGTDSLGYDVTWCEAPGDPPANTICDQDEIAEVPVDVINPDTSVTIEADETTVISGDPVVLTVKEKNDGDDSLDNPYVELLANGSPISASPLNRSSTEYVGGDNNPDNGDLDPGEEWEWQVTVNPTVDTTYTAIGHGTDSMGNDVTWCDTPGDPPADTVCDQDEKAEVPVDAICPDTSVTIGADETTVSPGDPVVLTVKEKNDGDDSLDNPYVELLANGSPISASPLNRSSTEYVGGDNNPDNGDLDPGEEWEWQVTVNPTVDTIYTAIGHGTDSLGNDVTWCDTPGDPPADTVCDQDEKAEVPVQIGGQQGCTPGFWKNNGDKHGFSAWCDRYKENKNISDYLTLKKPLIIRGKGQSKIKDPTLLQALNANGGGVNAMIRHGVAAMLNACSKCVMYPIGDPEKVESMIEATLNGEKGAYTVGELHSMFAEYNEAGCPVNQHGDCVGVED